MSDGSPWILISDLDGTLLGDDDGLRRFAAWYERNHHRLRLVYSSGRLLESIQESIHATDLPEPAAIIAGVGTEIRLLSDRTTTPEWPPASGTWCALRVRTILSDLPQLTLQPEEFQSQFKVSWYVPSASEPLLNAIRQRLRNDSIQANVVYSSDRDLDVLPADVDKGAAASFLATALSIPFDRVIVSGDSGNDLSMFRRGFRGIVVSNAHAELRGLRSAGIFQARLPMADGVLEGLRFWIETPRNSPEPIAV